MKPGFRTCCGCLEITGEHANYRIDITCDAMPTKDTEQEATNILRAIESLMAQNKEEYEKETEQIIAKFLSENPTITKVEWKNNDLTVWFLDSNEPWSIREFETGTKTRQNLEQLEKDLLGE